MQILAAVAQEKQQESYSSIKQGETGYKKAYELSIEESLITEILEGVKNGSKDE